MPTKDYKTDLLKRLANPDYAAQYLKAAFDETLVDGNQSAFLLALKNVIEAKETVKNVADNTNISHENLYRILNEEESPTLATLTSVFNAIGITIDFKPLTN